MKQDWKKIFESEVSDEARNRIFLAADNLIDEMHSEKEKASFWARLFSPAGGVALAGAAALAVLFALQPGNKNEAPAQHAAVDPELVRNIDMLLDLDTLEKWNPGPTKKVKAEWQKRKS